MTSPMSPGSPNRLTTTGPSRITPNRTRNSKSVPEGAEIAASTGSAARQNQRHVVLAVAEPPRHETVDGPVGLEAADGGVDDLAIRRAIRKRGGEALMVAVELAEYLEDRRLAAGQAERDRKVEQERARPSGTEHGERVGAVADDDGRRVRAHSLVQDRRQRGDARDDPLQLSEVVDVDGLHPAPREDARRRVHVRRREVDQPFALLRRRQLRE